jgi:nucleolar pre-ribosomal-associated protein 1
LKSFYETAKSATRIVLTDLICHILSRSILFQEDQDEPSLWLAALPTTRRAADFEAPDGTLLTDEGDSVIAFLDDCAQRCLKTPHRYIEEMHAMLNAEHEQSHDHPDTYPSPLLATVLEQLSAKSSSGRLSASDTLALASFVRKLTFKLSTKQRSLKLLLTVADRVDAILHPDRMFPQYPVITMAIRREVSIMRYCLGSVSSDIFSPSDRDPNVVQHFLNETENLPFREDNILSTFAEVNLISSRGHICLRARGLVAVGQLFILF